MIRDSPEAANNEKGMMTSFALASGVIRKVSGNEEMTPAKPTSHTIELMRSPRPIHTSEPALNPNDLGDAAAGRGFPPNFETTTTAATVAKIVKICSHPDSIYLAGTKTIKPEAIAINPTTASTNSFFMRIPDTHSQSDGD
jgi:hypothetical protein